MTFRVARHTSDLAKISQFYCDVLGLSRLGGFEGHDGYDGVFLGIPGERWHLEFTASTDEPIHTSDEDDALVFYPSTLADYDLILKRIAEKGMPTEVPKNPYWRENGVLVRDPDGYGVIVSSVKAL